jgi:hypothetical protein
MQTFLPYPDFEQSMRCLDYRRLGKQRVEAFQLLCANGDPWALEVRAVRTGKTTPPKGWSKHPAAIMWRGHDIALAQYMNAAIEEWMRRGYNNTMAIRSCERMMKMPDWFGNEAFHASHRSNLLRKDPDFYSKHGWTESPDMEYVWPK